MLAEMTAEYRSALPHKLSHIEALWKELVSGEWSPERYEELRRSAHTIAGAAKTFGLPAVSEAARALELALENFGDGKAGSENLRGVGALVEALQNAVAPSSGK